MSERVYKKGQRVSGHVAGIGLNAVFVALPDGSRGIIRQRELSWDATARRPDELFEHSQKVEAVVIGRDPHSGRLELSLRLASHDPWIAFATNARRGQIVHGIVTRVISFGAFVEIEPGIVGLVHISEIAPWRVNQVEDVLWVGDHVEAVILKIERARRRLSLSIQARMEQVSPTTTRNFKKFERDELLPSPPAKASAYGPVGQPARKIHTVLIADDDPGLLKAMRARMSRRGYQVETVYSGEAAVETVSERHFDVAFMDINFFPGIDGVQAARQIAAHRPSTVIVFMTGVELTPDQIRALRDYQTIKPAALLYKPLLRDEIDETLARIEGSQPALLDLDSQTDASSVLNWIGQARERRSPLSQQLTTALQVMCRQTGSTAAVFHLDPDVREVELLAQAGDIPMDFERVRYNLIGSPVGDVILGGESILENDVKGREGKFRHLLPLLNFGSCIGVPIVVWEETQHALFFFHSDAEHFSLLDREHALATATRLGAILERSRLDERLEAFQRLALQGQLTAALAHEANNKLSAIEMELEGVSQGFQSLAHRPASKQDWAGINQDLERLTKLTRETLDAVSIFQRLMRSGNAHALDVNQIVRDVVGQLRPLGRRRSVRLRSELSSSLPPCLGLTPRLHQACLNIALNAIQQIGRKAATGGLVIVSTSHEPHDERPIKISFRDDGPGIHRRDFERIFEMGYSTRDQEGTGLGLYVTRGLIEAMGGRVYVAESYILVGSTFIIELPTT